MRRYSLSLFAMIVAALAAPSASDALAETVSGSVREGNTLYREGKYEEALKKYETAQVESPDDERIMFNLGGVQYRLENYERALSEFMKAAPAVDETMGARSRYNAGNTLYRAGRLEDAIEQYLATLKIDPEDEDAKHNLEFVRREIERRTEQKQERQQQQEQEPDDSSETGEPQPQDQESQNQDGQPAENDQRQEQETPEQETDSRPETSPEQDQNERPEPPKKESEPGKSMSDDNLQRWLDAVEAETAENMKEFLRKQQPTQVIIYPEDW